MPSRHARCSAGVEPRCAARHLVKNPPPEPSPPRPPSDAGSPAPGDSRPAPPHAATQIPSAIGQAGSGSRQAPHTACLCEYTPAIAPPPSSATILSAILPLSLPSAVPPSLQHASFLTVSILGVTPRDFWPKTG